MARRWALPVPLHLQNDFSAEADELRLHLYQHNFHATQGRGFHLAKGTGSKRKHPRNGWGRTFHRAESLAINARYGARQEGI